VSGKAKKASVDEARKRNGPRRVRTAAILAAAFVPAFSVDSRFGIDRDFEVYDDTFQSQLPMKSENAERRAEETCARFCPLLISSPRFAL